MKKSVEELEKLLNANKATKIPVKILKDPEDCFGDCDLCPDEHCLAKGIDYEEVECPKQDECLVCAPGKDCSLVIKDGVINFENLSDRTKAIDSRADEIAKKKAQEKKKEDSHDEENILEKLSWFPTEEEWNRLFKSGHEVDEKLFPVLSPDDAGIVEAYKEYRRRVEDWMKKHKKFPQSIAKACLLDEYAGEEPKKVKPLSPNEELFKEIVDKMFDTYKRKNKDYGSSFDELFDEFGMQSALLRIKDKYNRLKAINDNGQIEVIDESVEDTLLDMANYAILTIIKLRNDKKILDNIS